MRLRWWRRIRGCWMRDMLSCGGRCWRGLRIRLVWRTGGVGAEGGVDGGWFELVVGGAGGVGVDEGGRLGLAHVVESCAEGLGLWVDGEEGGAVGGDQGFFEVGKRWG